MTTTAVRDTLCSLRPMEIPRPKCAGFQFVPTRGRMGFYMSIKRDGEKYGIQLKNQGSRRPSLPDPSAWGSLQIASNDNSLQTREPRNEAGQLNGTVSADTSMRLSQSRSSLVSAEDLLKMKAASQALSTQRQVIIPEEPEEVREPEPDYYYSENTYTNSQTIAIPITNAPPAPPLPLCLVLNMRRGSSVDSRSISSDGGQILPPKAATKKTSGIQKEVQI